MPDTSSAQINIGGTIATKRDLRLLLDAIEADDANLTNYEETKADELAAAFVRAHDTGSTLALVDVEAPYGKFPTIEKTCRDLGLAFHRRDDGHYAYGPIHVADHGEQGQEVAIGTIEQGPHISLEALDELLRKDGPDAVAAHIRAKAAAFALPPLHLSNIALGTLKT